MSEVRAKKALGQHFLVDLNIARKICDALSGGVRPEAGAETRAVAAGSADADAETRRGVAASADARLAADTTAAGAPAVDVVTAPSAGAQDESGVRARARAFAVPLLAGLAMISLAARWP